MVTKAIDEGLFVRIQNYVANDVNSKVHTDWPIEKVDVEPEDIYILSFTRVLNNWQAVVSVDVPGQNGPCIYKVVHDGLHDQTLVTIYLQTTLQEAII